MKRGIFHGAALGFLLGASLLAPAGDAPAPANGEHLSGLAEFLSNQFEEANRVVKFGH